MKSLRIHFQHRRHGIYVAHAPIKWQSSVGAAYFAPAGAGGLLFAPRYNDVAPTALANPIPDETAPVLAQHYGFTPEELDFIINYDLKYRLGRETEDEE